MDRRETIVQILQNGRCPAWIFEGENWTEEMKELIDNLFSKYMEFSQSSKFDGWVLFVNDENDIEASQVSWIEEPLIGDCEVLDTKLAEFFL